MAARIKLKRLGKIRNPQYRIVVADARKKRDGRTIEEIGLYHPKEQPSLIRVDSERAQYWLGVGAQPTEAVLALLKVTGDWQKFKGLPGAEGTLQTAAAKSDKQEVFAKAAAEAAGLKGEDAPKPKLAPPAADKPQADKPQADKPVADKPQADKPVADKPVADKPEADKPVADKPVAEKTVAEKTVADEPVAVEQAATGDAGQAQAATGDAGQAPAGDDA